MGNNQSGRRKTVAQPTTSSVPRPYPTQAATTANRNSQWEFVDSNITRNSIRYEVPVGKQSSPARVPRTPYKRQVEHQEIRIENNTIGHSYQKVFGHCLDSTVTVVHMEDPYIRMVHQIYNFLRFCELLVKSCKNLKQIHLKTMGESTAVKCQQQLKNLSEIEESLRMRGIQLYIELSTTLHDRKITFDNGWVVKIGRGLDYFKRPTSKFAIGFCDQELRTCYATTVDILRH